MMTIGPYRIRTLEAGDFKLDGGAMFGVVPKPLWSRTNPSDELNRIEMTTRCLLIESDERKILVDAGIGDKETAKFNQIFAVDYSQNTLEQSLKACGLTPEDVTDLIFTHLHFDHAGGSTRLDGSAAAPMFPNARHFVQKTQFEHALTRNERDRASYLDHNYMPIREAGLMELVEGDAELLPGVHVLTSEGHTPGLQTVLVTDGTTGIWYPADLLPLASHIPMPYIMGYDLAPLVTLRDKKRYLPRALEEEWILAFEHDAHCPACRLSTDDRGRIIKGDDVEI